MVNLYINDELIESIRFPVTDAGKESIVNVNVHNPLRHSVELIPFSNDPDVEVMEYPRHLKPMETQTSKWKFSPGEDRITPLESTIGFREIIG